MPRKGSIITRESVDFKRKNPITLGDDSNLETDFKPIKIGGENTVLELSSSTLDIKGSLTVNGSDVQTGTDAGATQLSELSDVTYSSGDLTIDSLDKIVASGDLIIDVDNGCLDIEDGGVKFAELANLANTGNLYLYSMLDNNDYFWITTGTNGNTVITTADNSGEAAFLQFSVDGYINFTPATHTYSAKPIGFTQDEPTFDATDTIITFSTTGNKAKLTLTNNCTDIHFKFPTVSGNFICVLLQDGTGGRTISNWKTQDSAGNAGDGNSGLVLWAGGTAPTNTETADKADIASFYWDADNEIAYGTYTYNF